MTTPETPHAPTPEKPSALSPRARHVRRTRRVFDRWAEAGRAEGMERSHGPVARRVSERLSLPPDGRYLDIGCGNGYTVRWVAGRVPDGLAVGIDLSSEMIRRARVMSAELGNVRFEVAEFPEHPLEAASFDAVFSMEVYYYLHDLGAALEATRELLKPGGAFACVVDFFEENEASHDWPEGVDAPMRMLSAAGWREAFEEAGFSDVRQERVVLPPEEAAQEWQVTVGSLVTFGRRGA